MMILINMNISLVFTCCLKFSEYFKTALVQAVSPLYCGGGVHYFPAFGVFLMSVNH